MGVAPFRRPPISAAVTHAHARWDAFCACANTYSCKYTHCYIHTYAHTYVPSGTHRVRPPRACALGRAVGPRRSGALTVTSGRASRPPPAAPRARSCTRSCAPPVRPPPGGSGATPTARRSGRGRQPCARARRGRRPATSPSHPTPRGSAPAPDAAAHEAAAQRRRRRKRTRRRRRADAQDPQEIAPAEPLGELLHLRVIDAPAAHRARVRPRPSRSIGQTSGRTGESTERHTAGMHTHPHARDRHTGAFGAVIAP
jgi:hypothetical protein